MAEQLRFLDWKDQVLTEKILAFVLDSDKLRNLMDDLADITIEMDKHG